MNMLRYWLRDFWCRLRGRDSGLVALAAGTYEIKITTYCTPACVFTSVWEPPHCISVCGGNVNYVGTRIVDDGFILYANISSSACMVEWETSY
jgi:hypothetical protein